MPFGVKFAQQPDVLHHDRQHPGQRPHADGAHEDQPQIAMSIPRSTSSKRRTSTEIGRSSGVDITLRAAKNDSGSAISDAVMVPANTMAMVMPICWK